MEKMIRISGLEKAYGEHRVLEALSMTLPSGETSCIMGPSGCGENDAAQDPDGGWLKAGGGVIEESRRKRAQCFRKTDSAMI